MTSETTGERNVEMRADQRGSDPGQDSQRVAETARDDEADECEQRRQADMDEAEHDRECSRYDRRAWGVAVSDADDDVDC